MRDWEVDYVMPAFPVSQTLQRWDIGAWQWALWFTCLESRADLQATPGCRRREALLEGE